MNLLQNFLMYLWYHSGNTRMMMIHRDFIEITKCSLYKIIVYYRDSGIFTVISNINLVNMDIEIR
jgi:hypothetical protein